MRIAGYRTQSSTSRGYLVVDDGIDFNRYVISSDGFLVGDIYRFYAHIHLLMELDDREDQTPTRLECGRKFAEGEAEGLLILVDLADRNYHDSKKNSEKYEDEIHEEFRLLVYTYHTGLR